MIKDPTIEQLQVLKYDFFCFDLNKFAGLF